MFYYCTEVKEVRSDKYCKLCGESVKGLSALVTMGTYFCPECTQMIKKHDVSNIREAFKVYGMQRV